MTAKQKATDVENVTTEATKAKIQKKVLAFVDKSPLSFDVSNEIGIIEENYNEMTFEVVLLGDKTEKTFKEHHVDSLPTLILLENNVEKQRIIGKPLNLKEQFDIWATNDFN